MEDQHRGSEAAFFRRLSVDSFVLCAALYTSFQAGKDPAKALIGYLAESGVL